MNRQRNICGFWKVKGRGFGGSGQGVEEVTSLTGNEEHVCQGEIYGVEIRTEKVQP